MPDSCLYIACIQCATSFDVSGMVSPVSISPTFSMVSPAGMPDPSAYPNGANEAAATASRQRSESTRSIFLMNDPSLSCDVSMKSPYSSTSSPSFSVRMG